MQLATIDITIMAAYAAALFLIANYIARQPAASAEATTNYFLAGRSLRWWAIGASLVAANISAEQIIGMSGSGYSIGLAIAAYEWTAAITLLVVGKYCLPLFLKQGVSTMPQYLERRYDHRVRQVMACFWLGVYVFVNLTSVLWLGALAVGTVTGIGLGWGLAGLGIAAAAYSVRGGMKAIALTDIIHVSLLVLGGLLMAGVTLDRVAAGNGAWAGFGMLLDRFPDKFDLILPPDSPHYASLPGMSVLFGGLWVMHFSYWGFNQYIVQRALAARSIGEAQKGILFAAFLKILMPVVVVLPGITALALAPGLDVADKAYPSVMQLLPAGARGIVFAALLAAVVSSLASLMNSVSTIFVLDLYSRWRLDRPERELVFVGRIAGAVAVIVAMLVARPLLGEFDQTFQYIQEFTGFFTPGIVVIFLGGLFWRGMTNAGALTACIGSAVLSLLLKLGWPAMPFLNRVGMVFLACTLLSVAVSCLAPAPGTSAAPARGWSDFGTSRAFNVGGVAVVAIVAALYATWW